MSHPPPHSSLAIEDLSDVYVLDRLQMSQLEGCRSMSFHTGFFLLVAEFMEIPFVSFCDWLARSLILVPG